MLLLILLIEYSQPGVCMDHYEKLYLREERKRKIQGR